MISSLKTGNRNEGCSAPETDGVSVGCPALEDSRPPIPALTGLRFVAAFFVLIAHLLPKAMPYPNAPDWYMQISRLSGLGMTLFFVLSGFVIHYNYSAAIEKQGSKGIFKFFVARFARLYPLYLLLLLAELAYYFGYSYVSPATAAALPCYLLLIQTWFYWPLGKLGLIYDLGPIASVAWSISTEWFFYCAYPLLLMLIRPFRTIKARLWLACLTSVIVCSAVTFAILHSDALNQFGFRWFGHVGDRTDEYQYSFYRWLIGFSPYTRIFEFVLGCICGSVFLSLRTRPVSQKEERVGFVLSIAILVATAVLHWVMFGHARTLHSPYHVLFQFHRCYGYAPFVAAFIFCCARYNNPISRALSSWPMVLCGEASYSLYLVHILIVMSARWEAAPVTAPIVLMSDSIRVIFAVLSAIGLSLVMWRIVEVPARRWIRNAFGVKSGSDYRFAEQTANR